MYMYLFIYFNFSIYINFAKCTKYSVVYIREHFMYFINIIMTRISYSIASSKLRKNIFIE